MEEQKNKNGIIILLLIIIAILSILCILLATDTIRFKKENSQEDVSNIVNKITAEEVRSFIVSDEFITTTNVVPAILPGGYVFLENGQFAYHNSSFETRFTDDDEHRLISFIGTWSTDGIKLVLNITKEERAAGGRIVVNEHVGNYLKDYTREVRDVNKTIEYTINKIDKDNSYISLTLNNSEVIWYELSGVGSYLNTPRSLAENGYNESYN